jgi:hypothetical protein
LATCDTFNRVIRNYASRMRNLPKDENGNEVPPGDFAIMDPKSLMIWRDFLYDSFTEDSECKAPLQLLGANGEVPILSVYRLGSATAKEDDSKDKERKGKGLVKAKGKKSKATVEDDDNVSHFLY